MTLKPLRILPPTLPCVLKVACVLLWHKAAPLVRWLVARSLRTWTVRVLLLHLIHEGP